MTGLRVVFVVLGSLCFVGCSAIPTDVSLVIGAMPEGVQVSSSDGWSCTAPCERTVERGSELELDFSATGYESKRVSVKPDIVKQRRRATYIGAGVGAVVGYVTSEAAYDIAHAITEAFFLGLFNLKSEPVSSSPSDHLVGTMTFAAVFGGIGYLIDNRETVRRARKPEVVEVVLQPE